ncbi:hypothetical protein ZMO02_15820 [Zymomonas mobilis subsp. pomaceae]|nr:hypothetical protein ZMO02_15820 [Zymomonas mobilis subsp. pomaceae]
MRNQEFYQQTEAFSNPLFSGADRGIKPCRTPNNLGSFFPGGVKHTPDWAING